MDWLEDFPIALNMSLSCFPSLECLRRPVSRERFPVVLGDRREELERRLERDCERDLRPGDREGDREGSEGGSEGGLFSPPSPSSTSPRPRGRLELFLALCLERDRREPEGGLSSRPLLSFRERLEPPPPVP